MSDIQGALEESVPSSETDIEARARNMGWRPLEEFRGDQSRWVDAKQFVLNAEQNLPVMNERYRALEGRYQKQEEVLTKVSSDLAETRQVLTEFREFSSRAEQRSYEKALRDLEAKRDVAVAHADTDTFKETQREIDELAKTVKPAAPAAEQQRAAPAEQARPAVQAPDPAIIGWIAENPWYNSDLQLKNSANAIDAGLMALNLPVAERLSRVKEKMQELYPEKFENPRRNGALAVGEPNSAANPRRNPKQKTFADLPQDAQAACDRIVRTMADAAKGKNVKTYTREDYVREYFAGEE